MTIKVELKNIKYAAFASEETHCYSATLYIDGVNIGEISNEGHGGCDMFHPAKGRTWDDYRNADARCKAELPPCDLTSIGLPGETMPQSLETVCGDLVNEFLRRRDLKRMCGRQIAFFKERPTAPGAPLFVIPIKGRPVPALAQAVAQRHPGAVVLNTLPEAEALKLFAFAV